MSSEAQCAHLRVEYRTENYPLSEADAAEILSRWKDDGVNVPPRAGTTMTRGWWECTFGCGCKFAPIPREAPHE